jgi:hypothetical protein
MHGTITARPMETFEPAKAGGQGFKALVVGPQGRGESERAASWPGLSQSRG